MSEVDNFLPEKLLKGALMGPHICVLESPVERKRSHDLVSAVSEDTFRRGVHGEVVMIIEELGEIPVTAAWRTAAGAPTTG